MNRDDIEEMYNRPYILKPKKKKKYTGFACVVDQDGNKVTNRQKVALTKHIYENQYKHVPGHRIKYETKTISE